METRQLRQGLSLDVALFAFVGLVLAEMGAYRTLEAPQLVRSGYLKGPLSTHCRPS
jgi:hypothetical protein